MSVAPALEYEPTMPVVLRRGADRFGDRAFVTSEHGSTTFAELERDSAELARALLAAGVGKGSRVGIHVAHANDWVTTWAAAARVGALVMPFSTMSTPRELARMLRIGDVAVLVVPPTMYGRDHLEFVERAVPGLASERRGVIRRPEAPYLRSVVALGDTDRAWATPVSRLVPPGVPPVSDELLTAVGAEVVPADEMLVVYTSGSTGEPKAVVHTHGNYFRKTALLPGGAPPPGSCVFVRMPFFWVGGLLAIGSALQHGSTIVCQERPDAGLTLELIERTRATDVIGWKGSSGRLVDHPDIAKRDVSSVPWLVTPRDPNRDQRLRHSTLGMTETMGSHAAGPRPGAPEEEQGYPLPERLRGSYGAPMPGMRHKVVDPDTGDVLPEGEEGEICVRGLGLMAGMYKRERADVFDRDGWYHTGDRGSLRDGYLFFTGRLHTMIKTGGANVSPEEVEDVLNAIPTVERAVVVGLPDPERDELVVAVVVPRPTDDFDVDALRAVCVEQLSTYKVPRRFVVMALDEVPWLPGGKPDREALVEKLLAG